LKDETFEAIRRFLVGKGEACLKTVTENICALCGGNVESGPMIITTSEPLQKAHASCMTAYLHGVRWAYQNPEKQEAHKKAFEFLLSQAKFIRYDTRWMEAARL
jgi:L-lactate utilization protein LutB